MQKDRKKEHKKILKYMRKWNKSLAEDSYLGLNRFRVDMYSEDWYRYKDESGGILNIVFKLTDTLTNNMAFIICDNEDYKRKLGTYLNDFLIRCSSGRSGHYPILQYVAYDIHTIITYKGMQKIQKDITYKADEGIIDKYNWLNSNVFKEF